MKEYPTTGELKKIKKWDFSNLVGLMEFVKPLWEFADVGYWKQKGRTYWLSTGGWSGNESIVEALQDNTMFWMLCWQYSRRGGHYRFHIPKLPPSGPTGL